MAGKSKKKKSKKQTQSRFPISLDKVLLAFIILFFSYLITQIPTANNNATNIIENTNETTEPDPEPIIINATEIETANENENNKIIDKSECIDRNENCKSWSDVGQCQRNHTFMLSECPQSCDSCSDMNWSSNMDGCPLKYPNCESCDDKLGKQCKYWLSRGECSTHPGYMVLNCAKTCKYCHLHDYKLRCPMNEDQRSQTRVFAESNDLNVFFENIVSYYNYKQTDLNWTLEVLSMDPWILRFDNFFDAFEANGIVEAAPKFERSTDVGKKDDTGHFAKITSVSRTSENSWCHQNCWNNPIVQSVMKRVENLMNISLENSEHLQILQYQNGQYYKTHHDYIPNHNNMPCGPRILTWFMYLSDVEEGGETAFPKLGIVNKAKSGRVILWPSVQNDDPTRIDRRTLHEARPVIKGTKYAANSWFHLYDFQTPNLWTCTG